MSQVDRRSTLPGLVVPPFAPAASRPARGMERSPVKHVSTDTLDIGYLESGPADGPP